MGIARSQLKALLWRHWLAKKRSPVSTAVEVLSSVLLIGVLVLAYALVEPDRFAEKIYVADTGAQLAALVQAGTGATALPCADLLSALAAGAGADPEQGPSLDPEAQGKNLSAWDAGGLAAATAACVAGANETDVQLTRVAVSLLQAFVDTHGPIPIPTLDEFILLHKVLRAALRLQPDMLDMIEGARRAFGWNVLGNLVDMGGLAFAPASESVLRFTDHLMRTHALFKGAFSGVFTSEAEAENYALSSGRRMWALVVFNEGPSAAGADYTIRMNYTTVPRTWEKVNIWTHRIPVHYKEYYTSGFLSLQAAIDAYVLGLGLPAALDTSLVPLPGHNSTHDSASSGGGAQGPALANLTAWTQWGAVMPTSAYTHNDFYDVVGSGMLGLLLCLALVYPVSCLVRGMVEEKETRMRETLKIMGLHDWVAPAAWAITYGVIFLMACLGVTIVCKASFLRSTSATLLFAILAAFAAAQLAFGALLAAPLSNAKVAGVLAPAANFACLLPRYAFFRTSAAQAVGAKLAASLLAPSAFTFAADLVGAAEGAGAGLTWRDLWAGPYPVGAALCMLLGDAALYSLLAWYLERVLPAATGAPLPWWFPASAAFWRHGDVYSDAGRGGGGKTLSPTLAPWARRALPAPLLRWLPGGGAAYERVRGSGDGGDPGFGGAEANGVAGAAGDGRHGESRDAGEDAQDVEEQAAAPVAARLSGLWKVYGKKVAVRDLSLELHQGEILALLGHNGAGKTSAMGMLTGLIRPSAGGCAVMGHSLAAQPHAARAHIGYCPQSNVLFDALTPREHLELFGAVKGIGDGAARAQAAASMLAAVGLEEKAECAAGTLSGGSKRKLQVGIALLADSHVVLLDEPSSGVDPASRQALWAILLASKAQRALLLTTHFLDEADALADRVAILREGRLAASGPALALKARYCDGMTLTVTTALEGAATDVPALERLLGRHVAGARRLRWSGAELVYQLRSGSGGAAVADLLDSLEAEAAALGVSHFAVSGPTLEEVFLAAAAADDAEDGAAVGAHAGDGAAPAAAEGERFSGRPARRSAGMANGMAEGGGGAATGAHAGSGAAHAAADGDGAAGRPASSSAHVANGVASPGAHAQADGKRSHEGVPMANGKEAGGQAAPAANGIGLGPGSAARADGAVELQAYQRGPGEKSALAPSAPALGPLSPAETSARRAESFGPPPASLPEARAPVPSASGGGSDCTAGPGRSADDMAEAEVAAASNDIRTGGDAEQEAAAAEQASSAGMDRVSAAGVPSGGPMGTSGHDGALGRSSEHNGEFPPHGSHDREGLRQGGSGGKLGAAPRAGDPELAVSGATAADAEWTAVSLEEPSMGNPAMQQDGACAEGAQGGRGGSGAFGRVLRRRHRRRLRWWVAFREMVRKRAIGAGRDARGALLTLLLPVVAVIAVLSVLKVNIDPTAPQLLLQLPELGQAGPLLAAKPPGFLDACTAAAASVNATSLGRAGAAWDRQGGALSAPGGACAGGLAFVEQAGASAAPVDSWQLSKALLGEVYAGGPAQYGAVVFNDLTLAGLSNASALDASQLLLLLPLLAGAAPGAAAGNRSVGGLLGNLGSGLTRGLAWLATPEAHVASGFIARLQAHPPVTLLHNASSFHALPALVSGLHETLGAAAFAGNASRPRFAARSHPLPLTAAETVAKDSVLQVLAALFVLVPFCYLAGAFAVAPVVERRSQAAHIQLLSGCPAPLYWAGSYAWDCVTYAIIVLLTLAVFAAYGDSATVGTAAQALGTTALLAAYGGAVIPMAYALSFGGFQSASSAQVAIAALAFVLGFVAVVGSYVMRTMPQTAAAQCVLVQFFRAAPPFLLGEGLLELTKYNYVSSLAGARQLAAAAQGAAVPALDAGVWAWGTLGRPVALLLLEAVAFAALTLALDWDSRHHALQRRLAALRRVRRRLCRPLAQRMKVLLRRAGLWFGTYSKAVPQAPAGSSATSEAASEPQRELEMADLEVGAGSGSGLGLRPERLTSADLETASSAAEPAGSGLGVKEGPELEDEDVAAERARVLGGGAACDAIALRRLRKVFPGPPPKVAVADLCLGIRAGERFGLLGDNGAGKTTTLQMLVGRVQPSAGGAVVRGGRSRLGFCPQQDALLELLTGAEQLALYARLKGVPERAVAGQVADVLARVSLPAEMSARPACTYSGGSRRKLSLAIALIGDADALLLDEPSSGMDPGARRAMWSYIVAATSPGKGPAGVSGLGSGPGAGPGRGGVAVVLTTHSMEECEALCARVGIMHQGRLRCLGSPSRLKARYGGALALEVQAGASAAAQAALAAWVAAELGAELQSQHLGRARFALPARGAGSPARVLRALEAATPALGITAYGLSLPTLEQVFINVIGKQLH